MDNFDKKSSKNVDDKPTAADLITILDSILVKEKSLISHHIDSFNQFVDSGIKSIMTETFRIVVEYNNQREATPEDKSIEKYIMEAKILDVKITNPTTVSFDTQKQEVLYPCEAHRKDLTYSSSMYVDVEVICKAFKKDGTFMEKSEHLKNHRIGSIPVMVGSHLCNTANLSRDSLLHLKEDPTDLGGYFIIKSNEWIIDNIESMTYNLPREFKNIGFKNELARSDIISKPGDNFENSSNIVCKFLNNGNIQFEITNNRFKNIMIPFFVLFRAFGVCDDKSIVDHIVYGLEVHDKVNDPILNKMITILEKSFNSKYASLPEAYMAHTQTETLELIGGFINDYYLTDSTVKNKQSMNTRKYNVSNVLTILDKDILPHIGLTSDDRYNKVRFLGHLIYRLLLVHLEVIPSTDRDSYKNKRVNPAGVSYAKVFKTNFNFAIVQPVRRQFTKDLKTTSFSNLNLAHSFETAIYGHEFERALVHAIIIGDKTISINRKNVQNRLSSQQLHRKNQINVISALRNINTTNTSSAKQSERANEMRRVHSSTIGYVCCVQSADTGEKVGMQKQMAISTRISLGSSSEKLKEIVREDELLYPLNEKLTNIMIYAKKLTKVFVNGYWIGCTGDHSLFAEKYRNMRREGKIHYMTTITMDVRTNEIYMWVDIGRIVRPLIIVYKSEEKGQYIKLTKTHINKLHAGMINYNTLLDEQIIEFISPEEQQNCLISKDLETLEQYKFDETRQFTHLDIAQAIIGIPGLTSPFTNHNQPARGIFQTNQVKQTCGIPCMNFPYKTYKEMYLQIYNQKPLVKTIANKYIQPIGMNAVVAIQIYAGYNQDDSLMMNQGAIDRGLFTTHHFTFEKTELDKNEEFVNPDPAKTTDIKAYSNYDKLVNGVVAVGTRIEKGDIVIGKVCKLNKSDQYGSYTYYDKSIIYKYEEPSYVWDVIKGRNEDDSVFCKVVFRSVRQVEIGNKFCMPDTNEVLTDSGWKTFKQLTMKDKICSLVDNEYIEYVEPIGIYHFEHDGEMVSIQAQSVASTTTLNHKLYVQKRNKKNYELCEAKDVYEKRIKFKKNGIKLGDDIKNIKLGLNEYDMDAYIQLLSMFIADGHLHRKDIVLTFIKPRKIKLMLEVCEKLNLDVKTYISNTDPDVSSDFDNKIKNHVIKNVDIYDSLVSLNVGALNKFLPDFVWSLNQRQSRLLLETLVHYDGHTKDNKTKSCCYYTSSNKLADDITRLALHSGWSGHKGIHNDKNSEYYFSEKCKGLRNSVSYTVSINKSKNTPIINNGVKYKNNIKTTPTIGIINYKGIVSCVEVPSHVFYVRENNKCHWTGNSSRSGQKGTTGMIMRDSDFPFTKYGMKPDIIFNPHSLPSRMTMGVILEGLAAKTNAYKGTITDATIFNKVDIDDIAGELKKLGFNANGTERLYNGITGNYMDVEIFIAPIYYQCLQKFTIDTVYAHRETPTDALTRQPLDGKSASGGSRLGEMECSTLSTSALKTLNEKTTDHSDLYYIYVCKNCNKRAIVNEEKKIYKCVRCKDDSDIVRIKSTWSCKTLWDEIESCNIGLKFHVKESAFSKQL